MTNMKILFHYINIKSGIIIKTSLLLTSGSVKWKEIFLFWRILPQIEVDYEFS